MHFNYILPKAPETKLYSYIEYYLHPVYAVQSSQ